MATNLSKEDIVRRKHRGQIQLGLVTYSYTGDSSSEDEDDDETDIVRKGEARIAWYPKGREEVIAEDKVSLHDRCLLPGDIVKYNVSTQTQKGIVKAIKVMCHLQVHSTRQMIYDIPSHKLQPIVPFGAEDNVVLDEWVGIVRESYNNVIVRFKSDARCSISEDNAVRLIDIHDSSDEDSVFGEEVGFFPGQVLQGPGAAFKGSGTKWLEGPRPILSTKSRFRVHVEEVKNVGLDVQWCSRAVANTQSLDDLKPPPMYIKGKELERTKLLNFSAHARVQIGDKFIYKVKEEDVGYPQAVTKGSILCFRKPEQKMDAELNGAGNSVEDNNKFEGNSIFEGKRIQSAVIQALEKMVTKLEKMGDEDGNLRGESAKETLDELIDKVVSGVGSRGMAMEDHEGRIEQSGPSEVGQATEPSLTSIPKECSLQENGQDESTDETNRVASNDDGHRKMVSDFLDAFKEVILQERTCEDKKSLRPNYEDSVRQTERNLQNLPSPSDIARASLKPGFSLVNGDTLSQSLSKSSQEAASKPDDKRLQSLCSNFSKLHSEMDTLQKTFSKLASGSISKSSLGKIFSATQEKMQEQVSLLKGIMESGRIVLGKDASALTSDSTSEVAPSLQQETESIEENDVVVDDRPEGEVEEEDKEEAVEEDIIDGEDQVDSDSGEEAEETEDKSTKAKSKTASQRNATRKAKRQKMTCTQPKKRKERSLKGEPVQPGQLVCVEVTHTSTVVDILWQDGTYEKDILSTDVVPCRQLDDLEFFPGDFVSLGKESSIEGYGVITQVDNKERTCVVNWITRNPDNPSKPCTSTEEHSVYELSPHSDFVFSTDDVVVRIAHNSKEEEAAKDLPPAGQVQEVNADGSITVRWVDDTRSSVFPHQLFKIEEEFDSDLSMSDYLAAAKEMNEEEGGGGGGEDGCHCNTSSDSSWETASGESGDESQEEEDQDKTSHAPDGQMTVSNSEPTDIEVRHTGEVETANRIEETSSSDSKCLVLQQNTDLNENKQSISSGEETGNNQTPNGDEQKIESEKEEAGMKLEITAVSNKTSPVSLDKESIWDEDGLQSPNAASRFMVVPSLPSYHYFSSAQEPTNQKRFLSTWRKEVRLLQTALPQGILAKAFEDRMDMFSVMIEGPVNTPYEDGVFFFDIRLLGDYPKTPPKVHYRSFCEGRLNPNLYDDGKVCLSLLGTWTGKGNEMWTSSSNLLQLLVSVQGLILVNEPYYNEAGYDKYRGTADSLENCRKYNETALVKLVQAMTKMVLTPPLLFKEEALMFCRKHGPRLVKRLESWLDVASRSAGVPPPSTQPSAEACPGPSHQQDRVIQSQAGGASKVESSQTKLECSTADLRISKAELKLSKAELELSKAELELSKAELKFSKAEFHSSKAVLESSKAEVERKKAELERSKSKLEHCKSELEHLKVELEWSKEELESSKAALESGKAETDDGLTEEAPNLGAVGTVLSDDQASKSPESALSSSSSSSSHSPSSLSNISKADSKAELINDTDSTTVSQTSTSSLTPPSTIITPPQNSSSAPPPPSSSAPPHNVRSGSALPSEEEGDSLEPTHSAAGAPAPLPPSCSTSTSNPEHDTLEPTRSSPGAAESILFDGSIALPQYSLFPLSKGFISSLSRRLVEFKSALKQAGIS